MHERELRVLETLIKDRLTAVRRQYRIAVNPGDYGLSYEGPLSLPNPERNCCCLLGGLILGRRIDWYRSSQSTAAEVLGLSWLQTEMLERGFESLGGDPRAVDNVESAEETALYALGQRIWAWVQEQGFHLPYETAAEPVPA